MEKQIRPSDSHVYEIRLADPLDEEWVAAFCPPGATVERGRGLTHLANLVTDQAGIVGLIRQLHGLGHTLISITCLG